MQILNDTVVSFSSPIEDALRHWVLNHIVNSDKKMSLMVREKSLNS
jgi:hemerythrin